MKVSNVQNAGNAKNIKNGWTDERRKVQAENIKQWKPWEKSTGAKTAQGKLVSSRNADKGIGETMEELKHFRQLLRENKQAQAEIFEQLPTLLKLPQKNE